MTRLPRNTAGVASDISFSEFVLITLNSGSRFNDVGVAVLSHQEDLSVVGPRRCSEAGARCHTLTPVDLTTGQCVMGEQEPTVEQGVVAITIDQGRGVVCAEQRLIPDDVVVVRFRLREARCRRSRRVGSRRPDVVVPPGILS